MSAQSADSAQATQTTTATASTTGADSPSTDVLASEQAHLDHARDQLRRMREAADRLDASTAGDA